MFEWCSMAVMTISSPGFDERAAEALRHEVDGLGRAAHEDDLASSAALTKPRTRRAGVLVGSRRFLAQAVDAAVDVGVNSE